MSVGLADQGLTYAGWLFLLNPTGLVLPNRGKVKSGRDQVRNEKKLGSFFMVVNYKNQFNGVAMLVILPSCENPITLQIHIFANPKPNQSF